jgi:hypothetical protein
MVVAMRSKPYSWAQPIVTIHPPGFDHIDAALVAAMVGILALFLSTL